ncbi:MAG: NAD-dependent DNA ligase LigA, partial [Clostridia bacterium]|nr:NAD-dependent DNA ligase LigA [Clostridia bacterium]
PLISDSEYDELYDRLVLLEKETGIVLSDSPTRRVGGDIIDASTSFTHRSRLYSLDKAKTEQELFNWESRLQRVAGKPDGYTVENKYDGLTLNLTYENGDFIRAVTRGNGIIGEDVTAQVLTIKTFPLKIDYKGVVEVQGEGIMLLSELEKYNKAAPEPLKNARNAVAGAIRNLDPKQTAKRKLNIIFYAVNYIEGRKFNSQIEVFEFLKQNRFKCGNYIFCENMDYVLKAIEKINESKTKLDYLIDGAVIKVNDFVLREKAGFTDKFPRWAIAYKFEAEEVTTILKDVIWNVGRTGKLTPLALLKPVELAGATVRKATLNNYGDIQRKKVKIGCRVLVRRSNDVIPEILGTTQIFDYNKDIIKPNICPDCKMPLTDDGVNLYCTNISDCEPQIVGRIEHFASKDAMDIEGLSEKTALQLYRDLDIKYVYQLYYLTEEQLKTLESFKQKKSNNMLNALEKSKSVTLDRFLYALAIPNVGKKSARDLSDNFKTLENVMSADKEQFTALRDFGDIVADGIINYFKNEENIKIINNLIDCGINIKTPKKAQGTLTGEFAVVTGTLQTLSRAQAHKLIEDNGGEVQSAITKSTTLLIAGEKAGSKLDKAKSLNIRIIDENQFLKIIGES